MAYTPPTPALMKARFPKFAAVDNAVLQMGLDEAARQVDESWSEGDFALARMLYAAHTLTLDGIGAGTEAELNAEGVGDFQTIKLGSLSLTRFDKHGSTDTVWLAALKSTTYGARFLALASQNVGGPLAITDAACEPFNSLARDFPAPPDIEWNP